MAQEATANEQKKFKVPRIPGDITIYVPWGNVAIFYKNGSRSNDLIRIGRIDGNGIEALSIPGSLSVRFERQRRETPENNSEQNPT